MNDPVTVADGVSTSPIKVLVADDTASDRMILEALVRREGHEVVTAADGELAVEAFARERPDIVLLDALMPRLDGFEAARQIKDLAGEDLVPIIFLTSLSDTSSLVRCLEAGGDDFISKPYNQVILQAKIKSFNRMRNMHKVTQVQRDQIVTHNEYLIREQTVAKQIFDNITHSGCLDAANVRHFLSPLAVFNGDVILAGMRPSGGMMILLGDFTGHGLPAAMGAMPLANCFYGMVQKGYALQDVIREINLKLKQILPVGVFCCAAIVELDFVQSIARIWNGGLPDCFFVHGESSSIEPIRSSHLPLGVVEDQRFKDDFVQLSMAPEDRLYLWSDGIIETRNKAGEMFGEERLSAVFRQQQEGDDLIAILLEEVNRFSEGNPDDDLSLVELKMLPPGMLEEEAITPQLHASRGMSEWELALEIKPSTLVRFDPLPMLLSILSEVPSLRPYHGNLYTILAELYSNALEHGVLNLRSSLKNSPQGFEQYYLERERRLQELVSGFIRFQLSHQLSDTGGKLLIMVSDSGDGFEHKNNLSAPPDPNHYSGRGIGLVRSLCDSVRYLGVGNQVEAVFCWQSEEKGDQE